MIKTPPELADADYATLTLLVRQYGGKTIAELAELIALDECEEDNDFQHGGNHD